MDSQGLEGVPWPMAYFKESYPRCEFFLLVGSDSLRDMHTWKKIGDYSRLVSIVGISRAGEVVDPEGIIMPDNLKQDLEIIEGINMVQSSTEIKRRISEKSDLSGFLDPLVERYILKYELYQ